jgi:hypothetical protein
MHRAGLIVMVAAALAVSGCGQPDAASTPDADDGVVVLAKADGWRDGLQEAAGHPYILMEVATSPGSAEQAWSDNVPMTLTKGDGDPAHPGVYETLEAVDLDQQAVVVFSSGQSGTCPVWVRSVSTTGGRVEVVLASTAGEGQACTDDFQPYRLVLAVDLHRLPSPDELPVDAIDVPSENLAGVEGRVVTYPAR